MDASLAQFHTQDCIGCRMCSAACPSARNGGIQPHLVVASVNEGKEPADVWKCLQCHRCSSTCPKGIKASEIILVFRSKGEMPDKMRKTYDVVERFGRAVMPSPTIKAQREELELGSDDVSAETLSKAKQRLEGVR